MTRTYRGHMCLSAHTGNVADRNFEFRFAHWFLEEMQ